MPNETSLKDLPYTVLPCIYRIISIAFRFITLDPGIGGALFQQSRQQCFSAEELWIGLLRLPLHDLTCSGTPFVSCRYAIL